VRSDYMTLTAGQWYHMAATYEGGLSGKIYVDGVDRTRATAAGTFRANSALLTLGVQSYGLAYAMPGSLDEVRIYRRALAAEELLPLSQVQLSPISSPKGDALRALVAPNPIQDRGAFRVEGTRAYAVKVDIYDLAGKRVFGSGWRPGNEVEWDGRDSAGRPLANGAYLYVIAVSLSEGVEIFLPPAKVFVRK